ncbi:hypothetical protein LILAB_24895 [Corallococcus macrosporus]|uniref:Uncharacterized protein n=1 Tax=Myxococcus fulvus (strain ATCC BAA-855 / HW-1) TaxID=483219 RepID=F8C6T2_MYXFH|nr:hypothetical protein LILAB_24895 [Corallococcus macrosporus]
MGFFMHTEARARIFFPRGSSGGARGVTPGTPRRHTEGPLVVRRGGLEALVLPQGHLERVRPRTDLALPPEAHPADDAEDAA